MRFGRQELAVVGGRSDGGQAHHERDGRAVDIGVDERDGVALGGERHGEVGRHGRLADAALAAGHGDGARRGAGAEQRV